jgi:hypothetical protein
MADWGQSQSKQKHFYFIFYHFILFSLSYFSNPNFCSSLISMAIEGVLAGLPTLRQANVWRFLIGSWRDRSYQCATTQIGSISSPSSFVTCMPKCFWCVPNLASATSLYSYTLCYHFYDNWNIQTTLQKIHISNDKWFFTIWSVQTSCANVVLPTPFFVPMTST